jgi:hypothetical protein
MENFPFKDNGARIPLEILSDTARSVCVPNRYSSRQRLVDDVAQIVAYR